jgi:hypothetical protein
MTLTRQGGQANNLKFIAEFNNNDGQAGVASHWLLGDFMQTGYFFEEIARFLKKLAVFPIKMSTFKNSIGANLFNNWGI